MIPLTPLELSLYQLPECHTAMSVKQPKRHRTGLSCTLEASKRLRNAFTCGRLVLSVIVPYMWVTPSRPQVRA